MYRFRAAAIAQGAGAIRFTAVNVPPWATFDGKLGLLQGIPGDDDIGTYRDIRLFAIHGTGVASLPAFAINVRSRWGDRSVSIQWTAPATNTDGSTITDLAGYRIYSGASVSNLKLRINVPNPGLTRYVIDSLPSGRHFFAITAVNTAGLESDFSALRTVLVP